MELWTSSECASKCVRAASCVLQSRLRHWRQNARDLPRCQAGSGKAQDVQAPRAAQFWACPKRSTWSYPAQFAVAASRKLLGNMFYLLCVKLQGRAEHRSYPRVHCVNFSLFLRHLFLPYHGICCVEVILTYVCIYIYYVFVQVILTYKYIYIPMVC